jgi:hypothetical protein
MRIDKRNCPKCWKSVRGVEEIVVRRKLEIRN